MNDFIFDMLKEMYPTYKSKRVFHEEIIVLMELKFLFFQIIIGFILLWLVIMIGM